MLLGTTSLKLVCSILMLSALVLGASPEPPQAEQQRILDTTRQYASQYIATLPNFFCERVTYQFESKDAKHWKQRDTVTSKLVFNRGKEEQHLETVNGKPVIPGRFVNQPLTTEGEFGILLANLLDGGTFARISWDHWEDMNGRRMAVFAYVIPKEHSTLSLSLGGLGRNFVPYRGFIYTDAASGEVWRVTNTLFDIPPDVDTRALTTTIDYGSVEIASRRFVLPVAATIQLETDSRNIENKVEFRNYRKFETESKITFAAGSDGSNF